MDEPCDRETLRACLRNLAVANRLTGSYRPTLHFLNLIAARGAHVSALRILDVGSGYGDMLREILRWARKRRIGVELTGVDLNPLTASIAAEATREAGLEPDAITWKTGNAFDGIEHPPDVIVSSLVMHHLEDEEIVTFLRWMEATARVGWFVNDLERQPAPARVWLWLARVLGWHRFLHHDGPVSFRRAFRVDDWQRLLALADIPADAVEVRRVFPARLCLARLR